MIGKRPNGYRKTWRPCTCHPSEAPVPCARKYALSACLATLSHTPASTDPERSDTPEGGAS